MACYAILALKGLIDPGELYQFGAFHSRLGHHLDRIKIPGVDISSGSLGHGLPLAVGSDDRLFTGFPTSASFGC